ncbi:hypothetical protein MIDIC_110071 [Alphaproteobacteria bacterium]
MKLQRLIVQTAAGVGGALAIEVGMEGLSFLINAYCPAVPYGLNGMKYLGMIALPALSEKLLNYALNREDAVLTNIILTTKTALPELPNVVKQGVNTISQKIFHKPLVSDIQKKEEVQKIYTKSLNSAFDKGNLDFAKVLIQHGAKLEQDTIKILKDKINDPKIAEITIAFITQVTKEGIVELQDLKGELAIAIIRSGHTDTIARLLSLISSDTCKVLFGNTNIVHHLVASPDLATALREKQLNIETFITQDTIGKPTILDGKVPAGKYLLDIALHTHGIFDNVLHKVLQTALDASKTESQHLNIEENLKNKKAIVIQKVPVNIIQEEPVNMEQSQAFQFPMKHLSQNLKNIPQKNMLQLVFKQPTLNQDTKELEIKSKEENPIEFLQDLVSTSKLSANNMQQQALQKKSAFNAMNVRNFNMGSQKREDSVKSTDLKGQQSPIEKKPGFNPISTKNFKPWLREKSLSPQKSVRPQDDQRSIKSTDKNQIKKLVSNTDKHSDHQLHTLSSASPSIVKKDGDLAIKYTSDPFLMRELSEKVSAKQFMLPLLKNHIIDPNALDPAKAFPVQYTDFKNVREVLSLMDVKNPNVIQSLLHTLFEGSRYEIIAEMDKTLKGDVIFKQLANYLVDKNSKLLHRFVADKEHYDSIMFKKILGALHEKTIATQTKHGTVAVHCDTSVIFAQNQNTGLTVLGTAMFRQNKAAVTDIKEHFFPDGAHSNDLLSLVSTGKTTNQLIAHMAYFNFLEMFLPQLKVSVVNVNRDYNYVSGNLFTGIETNYHQQLYNIFTGKDAFTEEIKQALHIPLDDTKYNTQLCTPDYKLIVNSKAKQLSDSITQNNKVKLDFSNEKITEHTKEYEDAASALYIIPATSSDEREYENTKSKHAVIGSMLGLNIIENRFALLYLYDKISELWHWLSGEQTSLQHNALAKTFYNEYVWTPLYAVTAFSAIYGNAPQLGVKVALKYTLYVTVPYVIKATSYKLHNADASYITGTQHQFTEKSLFQKVLDVTIDAALTTLSGISIALIVGAQLHPATIVGMALLNVGVSALKYISSGHPEHTSTTTHIVIPTIIGVYSAYKAFILLDPLANGDVLSKAIDVIQKTTLVATTFSAAHAVSTAVLDTFLGSTFEQIECLFGKCPMTPPASIEGDLGYAHHH